MRRQQSTEVGGRLSLLPSSPPHAQDVVTTYEAANRCLEDLSIDPFSAWRDQVDISTVPAQRARTSGSGGGGGGGGSSLRVRVNSEDWDHPGPNGEAADDIASGDHDDERTRAVLLDDAFYRFQHMTLLAQVECRPPEINI